MVLGYISTHFLSLVARGVATSILILYYYKIFWYSIHIKCFFKKKVKQCFALYLYDPGLLAYCAIYLYLSIYLSICSYLLDGGVEAPELACPQRRKTCRQYLSLYQFIYLSMDGYLLDGGVEATELAHNGGKHVGSI